MFLQRCWFKPVCRAPDKTHLVASQRRAGTVKPHLLFYFVMTTERIEKNNSQNLSLPSKSVSSWSRFLRKHKPVGRSTSCSSFLTSPRLLGVDVAKEMKPVKLIHSIPLWSKGNTSSVSAKRSELLQVWTEVFFSQIFLKTQHRCNFLHFLETSYLSIKRSYKLTTMVWI